MTSQDKQAQEARSSFEAWVASEWPNLATPEWFAGEDGQQQLMVWQAALSQGTRQAEGAPTVEQAITALVSALVDSKGWMRDYADSIVRDAIDNRGAQAAAPSQREAIYLALREYRCIEHVQAEDDIRMPLVDVLTHGGDIGPGLREIENLADAIYDALPDQAEPVELSTLMEHNPAPDASPAVNAYFQTFSLAASAPALQAQGEPAMYQMRRKSRFNGQIGEWMQIGKTEFFEIQKEADDNFELRRLYASPTHERAAPAPERKTLSGFVYKDASHAVPAPAPMTKKTSAAIVDELARQIDAAPSPSQPVAAEGMKAWQISERMPSHHRQRTSLENINDVLEVLAASQPAEVVTEFPYTRTFWSIAAAVTIEGPNTKAISVKAFQDEWNRRAAPGSAESKGDGNA